MIHHFLHEIGRISKTRGAHYIVTHMGNGRFEICTHDVKATVYRDGYDLVVELEPITERYREKHRIVLTNVFTEKFSHMKFIVDGEEYHYIHINGFGLLTPEVFASYIFEAIGKAYLYGTV